MKATKALKRTAVVAATAALALAGTMLGAGTAQAAYDPGTHAIWDDEPLYQGWHVDSPTTRLIMQTDGNLVIYTNYNYPGLTKAIWAMNTYGCGYKAVMQSDGNLVVYAADGRVCNAAPLAWGHPHAKLVVGEYRVDFYWGSDRVPHSNDPQSVTLASDLYAPRPQP
ncbi:hypothetical protein ABZW03_34690 [Kitasatospora sp. NPDC004799]|uniref:hypothetical protein n=1 Tax=Kitasatospora sp. NPDC004799 TaxID=3154460 RepID=UPI0033A61C0D